MNGKHSFANPKLSTNIRETIRLISLLVRIELPANSGTLDPIFWSFFLRLTNTGLLAAVEADILPSTSCKSLAAVSFTEFIIGSTAALIATMYCINKVAKENTTMQTTVNAFAKVVAAAYAGSYFFVINCNA